MTTGRDIIARLREAFPGLPPAALRWLSEHPETIQWPEDVAKRKAIEKERTAEGDAFWVWVDKTYTPSQIQSIQSEGYDYTRIWQHYVTRIAGTQWDVRTSLQSQLQARIDSGEITRVQAADLWNEEQSLADSRARADASRRTDFMLAATGGLEDPGDRERRLARLARLETGGRRAPSYRTAFPRGGVTLEPEPFAEFGTAEAFRTGFDVPQTENAISWFRRRFPRLIEQFQAKPLEKQTAQTWQEFLESQRPAIREERSRLSPFERGERPSVFRPRITTVGF